MGERFEPVTEGESAGSPPRHRRILVILAAIDLAGSLAAAVFISAAFGISVLLGSGLAFVNYFWLKRSLKKMFDAAAEGERPRMLGTGYFVRYLVLGLIVAFIYATEVLPIAGLILGLAGFGFAVIIEAFLRIFSGIFNSGKEV